MKNFKGLSKGGYVFLFWIFGMTFFTIEVSIRASYGALVDYIPEISFWTLAGHTSLWMFPVGGIIGILLGLLNEHEPMKKQKMIIQSFVGVIIVLVIELIVGILLNQILNLYVWDYSNLPFNILGQISLRLAIVWFFLCPFGFWLDDQIRHILNPEEKKDRPTLLSIYKKLFTFK